MSNSKEYSPGDQAAYCPKCESASLIFKNPEIDLVQEVRCNSCGLDFTLKTVAEWESQVECSVCHHVIGREDLPEPYRQVF